MSGSNSRPAKRRRAQVPSIGAPSEADSPSNQLNVPSSSAFSVRHVQDTHVQPLTYLCARVFVANLPHLSMDRRGWEPGKDWEPISAWMKALPDTLVSMIYGMLRTSHPELLSHELVKDHFLRGNSVTLNSDMGGIHPVNKFTVGAIASMGTSLVELHLSGFDKILDQSFAAIIKRLPSIEVLYLGGCTKVGAKTVEAAATSCPALRVVNYNYTSVLPVFLAPLLLARKDQLEVLKVAGIPSWTDAAFAKLSGNISADGFSMPALRTLKLRQASLSDASFAGIFTVSPNIRRLDLSFTKVRRILPFSLRFFAELEKLSLTSTTILGEDLVSMISLSTRLETFAVGALGGGQGQASAIGNTTAMTMTDGLLNELTDVLASRQHLRSVNLVGNTKLKHSLPTFVRRVGRRLKRLNLSGISSLRSSDLEGLAPEDPADDVCALEELILNSTAVDDDAAQYIAYCPLLETLEVAGTKFTNDGLFRIIDACPKLAKLDLTRCRGVSVVDRRRFFEVWEEQRSKD
ncbi:RNI-like protein [Artomyces pyxidatus]|uniref:RNI-like protein n=1 Tax=Artomyces pyxidatus TaxID=48021 RepID=A0ACB8TH16_9AGAM|nr:RNI-like protein [Artomyces pyxidatus]